MTNKTSITPEDLKQVVDLIVPLEKNGDVYDGYCPFCSNHNEPSFIYDPVKMKWNCHDCESYGYVIDLVQHYNKVSPQRAKDIIKEMVLLLHESTKITHSNSTSDPIPVKANNIQAEVEEETVAILSENNFSSSLIDEITGLVLTLRSTRGFLGMVLSSNNHNICSKIPEGMNTNIVTSALEFKNLVKNKIHETLNNYNVDPIEILLVGSEFKILLFEALIDGQSNFDLCLFIDNDTSPSMLQLHIRNALIRLRAKNN